MSVRVSPCVTFTLLKASTELVVGIEIGRITGHDHIFVFQLYISDKFPGIFPDLYIESGEISIQDFKVVTSVLSDSKCGRRSMQSNQQAVGEARLCRAGSFLAGLLAER